MEKNLTTGSVSKTIVYFALPYLLSYFLQTLYGMADLFITGQFCGVDSITAVSNGSQVMHMLTVIIVGLAMGTTVVIGRAIGADNKENATAALALAYKKLDKAQAKGIVHKNFVARHKAQLAAHVNSL